MGDCGSKPESRTGGGAAPGAAPQKQNATPGQDDHDDTAQHACPATVVMFSGCKDKQTSADVGNVMSLGVPGGYGAGGACTNALLKQAYGDGQGSFGEVLTAMVKFMEQHGYTQRPMLSTSRKTDLNEKFSISASQPGAKRALLVGINYVGHEQGRLNGCVNDVASMKRYLEKQGFDAADMTFVVDEQHPELPNPRHPSKAQIEEAIEAFTAAAKPGDSLFFHYSGHGGQKRDDDGDEADGKDETLIPEDYKDNGVIRDDELFTLLCAKLPKGVRLVCVMDCCHSGTILDLPYAFEATDEGLKAVESGTATMHANSDFNSIVRKMLKHYGSSIPGASVLMAKFGL